MLVKPEKNQMLQKVPIAEKEKNGIELNCFFHRPRISRSGIFHKDLRSFSATKIASHQQQQHQQQQKQDKKQYITTAHAAFLFVFGLI